MKTDELIKLKRHLKHTKLMEVQSENMNLVEHNKFLRNLLKQFEVDSTKVSQFRNMIKNLKLRT